MRGAALTTRKKGMRFRSVLFAEAVARQSPMKTFLEGGEILSPSFFTLASSAAPERTRICLRRRRLGILI